MGQGNIKVIENDQRLDMKRRMADIRQMHRNISRITDNKDRTCLQYLDDFIEHISQLIVKLEIFPYHLIWECLYQEAPEKISVEDRYILLDVTPKVYRQTFLTGTDFFNYGRDKYLRVPLSREEFSKKFVNCFAKGTPEKIFEIPVKPGYTYFNLPVFVGDESLPRWILTLVYSEENRDVVAGEDFFPFMEHLSHEIGMAGEKFLANVTAKLLEQINYQLAWGKKTESDSGIDQLRIITRALARQLQVDWCGIFLFNEQKNALKLEAANMGKDLPTGVSLFNHTDIFAVSFKGNETYRLLGRVNLENTVKPEIMKSFERAIRKEKKQEKIKLGKHHFTPYVLFEHALLFPIEIGNRKPGIITLFRTKTAQEPEPPPEKKFPYESRPFSAFETDLLMLFLQNIFYLLIAHDAIQKRMRDTRNLITQVVKPISTMISSTKGFGEKSLPFTTIEKISETLQFINALSIVANQYITNFEKLMDIDTRKLYIQRENILDIRKHLIEITKRYIPLSRKKFIHINVTPQTPSNISIGLDKGLFDVAISNIIENAIKFSFDPEERLKLNLKTKPDKGDKENVQITAGQDENVIAISISNYGLEIIESEREKIFERDFMGANSSDRPKGSGLGLYLAKEIIEMHGGTLGLVLDTPPHNTVFKIILPRKGI